MLNGSYWLFPAVSGTRQVRPVYPQLRTYNDFTSGFGAKADKKSIAANVRSRPKADTFTINRDHGRYAGSLPPYIVAGYLATAAGYLGASAEYLENVVAGLDELGIRDATLLDVRRRATALREGQSRN